MELNLPTYQPKVISEGGTNKIFCLIRKKYLVLNPEEWVRQHFVNFLVTKKGFPKSLLAAEMGIKYNRLQKRGDIIAYCNNGKPILIVECKAPTVKISQDTFDQVARYNMALKVKYVAVTNGLEHYFCTINHTEKSYSFLEELPTYQKL